MNPDPEKNKAVGQSSVTPGDALNKLKDSLKKRQVGTEWNEMRFSKEELQNLDSNYKNHFINSVSGYKSLNLCGTAGKNGMTNLAIFNTVFNIGTNPPLLGMLFNDYGETNHTLENIRATGFFTLNHIQVRFFSKAHQTAAHYFGTKSEFDIVGLNPTFSSVHPAPYVLESPVKIGLELKEEIQVRSGNAVIVVGEIIETFILRHAVLSDGFIDLGVTGTITGSGIDTYYTTNKIARLSPAKPDTDLNIIG